MPKHILVISQYFFPEEFRINDICKEWIKRGYKVTVVTGIPNYPVGKFFKGYGFFKNRKEVYEGIEIIRLPIIPRGSNSLTLALNYVSFVISGFFWKMFFKRKIDFVFTFEVSPMTQALVGVWISKKSKVPSYIYVQDLWPENVEIVTGIKNKRILNLIGKMVDYIYENSSKIFTTSNSFSKNIVNRGVHSSKVTYWPQYAESFYIPVEKRNNDEIPFDGKLNITFTGNIGTAQGLDILPKVAILLKENKMKDKVRFNIIGEGRFKKELIDIINKNKVTDLFNFIDRKPANTIPHYLASSDVAFLSFSNHELYKMTIPAKLQSYLACGKPVIASASGETKRIIEEAEVGFCAPNGDVEGLFKSITQMLNKNEFELIDMGKKARMYYAEHFDKEMLLDKMDNYLNGENMEEDKCLKVKHS